MVWNKITGMASSLFTDWSFAEASMAFAAYVATADGSVSVDEQRRVSNFVHHSKDLHGLDRARLIDTFESYSKQIKFDPVMGFDTVANLLRKIKDPDKLKTCIRLGISVARADRQGMEPTELAAIDRMIRELRLNSSDYHV